MKKFIFGLTVIFYGNIAMAQSTFSTIVKDYETGFFLKGVTVSLDNEYIGATDDSGFLKFTAIRPGKYVATWSSVNYKTFTDTIIIPTNETRIIFLNKNEEMEEVIVQSTRTGRTIANTPTRVEMIDGEELDEKMNMRPSNVSMLLHESTGIQVQQTSATSGNSSIRVQGLDGRYTQLLKDGYPNFGNFASGLSILEIPPLDLKQVEVIKGPASTLFGGGAIAGVINFISKKPIDKFDGDVLINQSNVGQTNIGAYLSQRQKKIGYSFLGQFNWQKEYDVDKDDFSELPKNTNFVIHPKLYFYPDNASNISISNELVRSNSVGGDMHTIKKIDEKDHLYFEQNKTLRNTTALEANKNFSNNNSLKFKQSISVFQRDIQIPNYEFSGRNTSAFTDLSYLFFIPNHTMIAGLNLLLDKFDQAKTAEHNNQSTTAGLYYQDTWDLVENIKLETGFRLDHVAYRNNTFSKKQFFPLPRISALFKLSNKISSRMGGGLGYKIPTIFTEQAESLQYRNIASLNSVTTERSAGLTADVNYKTSISEDVSINFNQLFFYTRIANPLLLEEQSGGVYSFFNASKPANSRGFETNLKVIFKENLKFFGGYTFTTATQQISNSVEQIPLMPKHKINTVIMYEKEDNFKVGLEGYYTGTQILYNGFQTPSFWEFGFMVQKTINKFTLFVNFENFTDERQSKYKTVVNPPYSNPVFDDIWNHTEGRMINGGIKIKLQ